MDLLGVTWLMSHSSRSPGLGIILQPGRSLLGFLVALQAAPLESPKGHSPPHLHTPTLPHGSSSLPVYSCSGLLCPGEEGLAPFLHY